MRRLAFKKASCIARCDQMQAANLIVFEPWPDIRQNEDQANTIKASGTDTLEEGAAEAVRVALMSSDEPIGTFTHATMGAMPW